MLSGLALNDPESKARFDAFPRELHGLGWNEGQNIHFDFRSGGENAASRRKNASELVGLAPEVILAIGSVSVDDLLQATRTFPIAFTVVADPVGAGYVESLAQPGGNVTGFMMFDYNLSGKWLELLKELIPDLRRAGVLRESAFPAGIGQFAVIQAVAPSLGVDVRPIGLSDAAEIERAIGAFASAPAGGLIVTAGPLSIAHRDLIIALAAQYKLPTVCPERLWVADGGLMSDRTSLTKIVRQRPTSIASSEAQSRPIFRYKRRPNIN